MPVKVTEIKEPKITMGTGKPATPVTSSGPKDPDKVTIIEGSSRREEEASGASDKKDESEEDEQ